MDLDSLLSEIGQETADKIRAEFSALEGKVTGKTSEISRLIGKVNALKDSIRILEVDPDDSLLTDRIAELGKKLKGNQASDGTISALQKQVEKLTADYEAKAKKAQEMERSTALSELSKTLSGRVLNHDSEAFRLVHEGRVRFSEALGKVVFVKGEDEIDLSVGVDEHIKARPEIAINDQIKGSGTPPAKGSGSDQSHKTISLSEFERLSPRDRAAKIADGYTPVD